MLLLGVKLLLWPFVEVTDADAVSRILFSLEWAKSPHLLNDTIWPPGHFYFLGIASFINSSKSEFPILLHIFISWLAFFPVYRWMKNLGSHRNALITAIVFSLSPLVLRMGNTPLAESFLLLLLPLVFVFMSKPNSRSVDTAMAGLMMTLACAFRYEAWLLSALIGSYFLLKKQYGQFVLFGVISSLFPLFLMASHYGATGDFLFGIHGNAEWTQQHMGMQFESNFEVLGRRLFFFIFSLFIATGPLVWLFAFSPKKSSWKEQRFFLVIAGIYLIIMTYQAVMGSLMLHHRFTAGLFVLCLPLLNRIAWPKNEFIATSVVLTICLSLVYPMQGISPLPRLSNREIAGAIAMSNELLKDDQIMVIDFMGWDNTYYGLLYSKAERTLIVEDRTDKEAIHQMIHDEIANTSLVLIVKSGGALDQVIQENNDFRIKKSWLSTNQKYSILEIEKK